MRAGRSFEERGGLILNNRGTGGGEGEKGRMGQVNMSVVTMNSSCGGGGAKCPPGGRGAGAGGLEVA